MTEAVAPVAIADRADLEARAGLPDVAASSATIVLDATATAARAAGKRHAPAPDGCCPALRTTAASTPRMQTRPVAIGARREIAVRRGSRALTTVVHARPWGAMGIVLRRVARGRKVRLAHRAQGRVREARVGRTGRPSDPGRRMLAEGQDHARRAMADAVSVPGGLRVAMVGRMAAMVVGASTEIGPDADVAAGTSQRFRK